MVQARKDYATSRAKARRDIKITHPWLHLPVKNGAPKRRVRFYVDGEMMREFDIELAEDELDFWVFCDVSGLQGQTVTIETDELGPRSQALCSIRQADTVPGRDTMYRERYRPQFHYTPRRGWVNDPNGLVYYDGEYHFFYQHNPYDVQWGNMHWGHAVSPDLIHWQECPEALYPDRLGTMFSGSAVVDWHNTAGLQEGPEKTLVAIYTAAGGTSCQSEGQPFTQCIAYSNDRGRTWRKFEGNPVLAHIAGQNRDPKVIWHAPTNRWVMILYLDQTEFGFFASSDLKHWIELSRLDLPGMHEVPDLFELAVDGDPQRRKWVLLAGHEQFVTSVEGRQYFPSGHYHIGEFDGSTFKSESGPYPLEWGEGCYSTQTFSDIPEADGRRIQIAWMSTDFRSEGYPGMPFHGQFRFPCELTLRTLPEGIRLCRQPVREIELLHEHKHTWKGQLLTVGESLFTGVIHDLLDIRMDLDLTHDAEWDLRAHGTTIHYSAAQGELGCFGEVAPLAPLDGRISLEVLADRTSIEVFAGAGACCMSGYITPCEDAQPLEFHVQRGNVRLESLDVFELRSIWE